ncbi:MAG: hypothetical protein WC455_15950 [Dehalococcoidia bacterium]|jgi:hypothetical protein
MNVIDLAMFDKPARVTVLHDRVSTYGLRVEGRGRHAADATMALAHHVGHYRYDVTGFRVYGSKDGIKGAVRLLRERGILHELVFAKELDGIRFDLAAGA